MVLEATVVVGDVGVQVNSGPFLAAVHLLEFSLQGGCRDGDVSGRLAPVLASPLEVTVVVSEDAVKIESGVVVSAGGGLAGGTEDTTRDVLN